MLWLFAVLLFLLIAFWWYAIRMPGTSYPADKEPEPAKPDLVTELRRDIEHLAGTIGDRNVFAPKKLAAARDWIESELRTAGFEPRRQSFDVSGVECSNIDVEIEGSDEIVVIGGHYDSVQGCPAANDNGSGTVATLALARRFAGKKTGKTLRFVFFVNEEPPWFQTEDMGSVHYANACRERGDNVVAMVSVETIGYFTSEPDSQQYPLKPLKLAYGDKGNFVAFVGNFGSRGLVRSALAAFREEARIPSKGIALMEAVPGVGWSDHWAFWQAGYEAIMVTDTAPFRYPHYHERTDTPDKLRYEEFARVVEGLEHMVATMVR